MRAITTTVVYQDEITDPADLTMIHETTNAAYEGVVSVYSRLATQAEQDHALENGVS